MIWIKFVICQLFPLMLLTFKIVANAEKIDKKIRINHFKEWIIIAVLTIIVTYFNFQVNFIPDWKNLIASLVLAIGICYPYSNIGLNLKIGEPINYIGELKYGQESKIDSFWHKFDTKPNQSTSNIILWFQGILLIICIFVFIILIK